MEESLKHNALNICYSLDCAAQFMKLLLTFWETPIFSKYLSLQKQENKDTLQAPQQLSAINQTNLPQNLNLKPM